jgi:hypothetical protein
VRRVDDARQVRTRFDKAWARADVSLAPSRMAPVINLSADLVNCLVEIFGN